MGLWATSTAEWMAMLHPPKTELQRADIILTIPRMTEIGKASDHLLTEEDYRPRHSEGTSCPACHSMRIYTRPCYFECHRGLACPCIYHKTVRLEVLRDNGLEGSYYWHSTLRDITRAEHHNEVLQTILAKRKSAELHKQNKANAESKLGPREFTLTYSPTWGWTDEEAQQYMKSAIERLTNIYRHEIIEFHAIGEFGHDGRSHVHAWYHLHGGRKITDKNFKRVYARWNPKRKLGKGFEGGHHATIDRVSDFAGYTEKHLEEAWMKTDITNAVLDAPSDTA